MYMHFISTSSDIAFSGRFLMDYVDPGRPYLMVSKFISNPLEGICLFKRFL